MAWEGKSPKSRSAVGFIAALAVNAALIGVLLTALVIRNGEGTTPKTIDVEVKNPDENKVDERDEPPIPIPPVDDPKSKPDIPDEPTVIVGEPSPPLPGKGDSYPRPGANSGEPVYPPTERRLGHAGNVVLALCVDAEGKLTSSSVKLSSGYPALDQAALDWARRIKWRPGTIEGRAAAICFDQPYRFVIRDE